MLVLINRTKTPASIARSFSFNRRAAHRTSTANESEYGTPSISTVIITIHRSLPSFIKYCVWVTLATGGPMYKCVVRLNLNRITWCVNKKNWYGVNKEYMVNNRPLLIGIKNQRNSKNNKRTRFSGNVSPDQTFSNPFSIPECSQSPTDISNEPFRFNHRPYSGVSSSDQPDK